MRVLDKRESVGLWLCRFFFVVVFLLEPCFRVAVFWGGGMFDLLEIKKIMREGGRVKEIVTHKIRV